MMKRSNKTLLLTILLPAYVACFPFGLSAREDTKTDVAIKAMYDRLHTIETLLATMPVSQTRLDEYPDPDRFELLAEAGKICHDIQAQTSTAMAEKGFAFLDEALSWKDDPGLRAYLGSLHLIEARDAKSIFKKIAEVDRGLKEIDRALEAVLSKKMENESEYLAEEILVRVIRVECSIGLPDMFNRIDSVTEDLNWLLKKWVESPTTFQNYYPPSRLLGFKAKELDLRGKKELADRYRIKAAELEGDKQDEN